MLHSFSGRVRRKRSISRPNSACSTASSALPPPISRSSSKAAVTSPPPRLRALSCSARLMDKLRLSRPKKVRSTVGRCGGIAFHAAIHVSTRHSSTSPGSCRIRQMTARQYAPYFFSLWAIAASSRRQYSSMISPSSTCLPPSFFYLYTQEMAPQVTSFF